MKTRRSIASRAMAALHAPIYRSRQRALVGRILPHLREGDRVLDVGCGAGVLVRALREAPGAPGGLEVEGLERHPRGGEPIPVHAYDGRRSDLPDLSYDVVMLLDVLHHDEEPDQLMRECRRLSRRLVIVKDHLVRGPVSQGRVSFIDWAANAPYAVKCLYRYHTRDEWREFASRHELEPVEVAHSMKLYPPVVEQLFGGALHYFGVFETSPTDAATREGAPSIETPRPAPQLAKGDA